MRLSHLLVAFVALALVAAPSPGQFNTDFESVTASQAGTVLTGQGPGLGYYLPNATSVDFLAYSYENNPLGIEQNPTGGCQFVGGTGPAGGIFARAQLDITYVAGAQMTLAFDLAATFTGTLPSSQNVGSFSVQPFPGSQSMIALARWVDPTTATAWNMDFIAFDAAGVQTTYVLPDPAFLNIPINEWRRVEIDVDLGTNAITALRITDLNTGVTTPFAPTGWYLEGGSANPSATPTGFRLFAGGGTPGNVLAFDNVCIDGLGACLPPPATVADYQVNGPDASMSIQGQTNGGFCGPAANTATAGVPFMLDLASNQAGNPWDIGTTTGPLLPASGGGIVLGPAEILNLNLGDPSFMPVFNIFQSGPFSNTSVAVTIPGSATISAQFVILNAVNPSGYSTSQGINLIVP